MKIAILAGGFKGLNFLQNVSFNLSVSFVSSYSTSPNAVCFFEQIKSLCVEKSYPFYPYKKIPQNLIDESDYVFVIGWQFIIHNVNSKYIIFHDSLLPKYRGFSPTVTALINGDNRIGITALEASQLADRGRIYEQVAINIDYPITIKQAYIKLTQAYIETANQLIQKATIKALSLTPQVEEDATYSIWRDEEDYFVDWTWSAEKISRFVNAVGWPYSGARTIYQSNTIFIEQVIVTEDIYFEDRHIGKIWSLNNGFPEIICGQGMIKIISAKNKNQEKVQFKKLRSRFKNRTY